MSKELSDRYRSANPAYARVRAGTATVEDLALIEGLEADLSSARVKAAPRSFFDLPVARAMWNGDARERDNE